MSNPLFEPFELNGLRLPNRLVMAPMTRLMSPGGVPGPEVAAYYRARAEGGVGLIVTEGTTIGREAASNDPRIPNFHASDAIDGWSRVVREVHLAGGKIAPQLWHLGASRQPGSGPNPAAISEGPSAIRGISREMTAADITGTVEAFARSAEIAKAIGFDAVELHGAHGYLIDQFLWNRTNRRADAWGGRQRERARFGAEIIRAVRERVGSGFPIIMRFSQFKMEDYGARNADTPQELEAILTAYAEAGVDALHASQRRFWEPAFEGSALNLAGWAKKLTGKPSITVGSVGLKGADAADLIVGDTRAPHVDELSKLEERLSAGEFDLVAVGRALLTDPQWPNKVRDGRTRELRGFDLESLRSLVVGAEQRVLDPA